MRCWALVTQVSRSAHELMPPLPPASRLTIARSSSRGFQLAEQIDAHAAAHIQSQARVGTAEGGEQLHQMVRAEILGHAEAHRAVIFRARDHVARFAGQRQHAPCVRQQTFAFLGELDAPGVTVEQRPADVLLQAPDLLADRRLAAVYARAGAREAAGIHHRHEAMQQLEIEQGSYHSYIH